MAEQETRRGFSRVTGTIADRLHAGDQADSVSPLDQAHRVDTGRVTHSADPLNVPAFLRRPSIDTSLSTTPTKKPATRISRRTTVTSTTTTTSSKDTTAATAPARKVATKKVVTTTTPSVDRAPTTRSVATPSIPRQTRNLSYQDAYMRGLDPEDRHNHVLPALIIGGGLVSIALAMTLLQGGGAPVASATGSPERPTDAPTALITPEPSAAAGTPNPGETVLNVNNLDVQTLISLFKLNPSLVQAFQADGYALNPNNLSITYDKDSNVPGVIIKDDKTTGLSHLIATLNSKDLTTVAQGYWDAKLPLTKDQNLNHQAISFALAPGNLLPAKEVTEWAVDQNQTINATNQALKGQAKLEAGTQPNVCTLEITKTIQAVNGNEQTVNPDNWEAEKLTPKQAASLYGRDAYSENYKNWKATPDGFGMVLQKPEDGTNTIIDTVNAVAQVYWDVKMPNSVSEGHQVVAGTLAPNVTAPVREATVYKIPDAVVESAKDDATLNAWAKHVNLEINGLADPNSGQTPDLNKIQKGVYVALVTNSVCPLPSNSTTTAEPTNATTVSPEATPAPTADWMLSYENFLNKSGVDRAHLLAGTTNGLKIEVGPKIKISIGKGEKIDTPMGSFEGPWTGYVVTATIWKIS